MKMWVGGRVEDKLQSCVRSVTKRVSSSVRLMSRVRHMLRRLSMVSSCSAARSDASNARACAAAREGGTEQCVGEERETQTRAGTTPLPRHSSQAAGLSLTRLMSVCTSCRRNGVAWCGSSGPHVSSVLRTSVMTPCQHALPRDQLLVLLVQVRRLLDQLQQRPEEMPFLSCHHLLTRGAEKACCEVKRGKKRKRWGKKQHKQDRRAASDDTRAGPRGHRAWRRARRWSGNRRGHSGWSCCGSTAARTRARPSHTTPGMHSNSVTSLKTATTTTTKGDHKPRPCPVLQRGHRPQ